MFECQEDGDDFDNSDFFVDGVEQVVSVFQESFFQESVMFSVESFDDDQWSECIFSELLVDIVWEDIYQISVSSLFSNDDDEWDFIVCISSGESLYSYLFWQVNLVLMLDIDWMIVVIIIDSINNDGYFEEFFEEIFVVIDLELDVEFDEVEVVLCCIQ